MLFNIQGRMREEESKEKSVLQTQRVHLYPFRTQKLSSAVVTILYGRLYGKIAQCWHRKRAERSALCPKETEKTTNHFKWGCSSAGRAPALQAGGHGFESHHLHQGTKVPKTSEGIRSRSGSEWRLIIVRAANDWARSSRESRIPSSPPNQVWISHTNHIGS